VPGPADLAITVHPQDCPANPAGFGVAAPWQAVREAGLRRP